MRGSKIHWRPVSVESFGAEDRLGAAELLVIAGDNQSDVVDGVGGEIIGIILRIEIGEQAIFFGKRAVPIPTKPAVMVRLDLSLKLS